MTELKWTQDRPTEPGHYLRRNPLYDLVLHCRILEKHGYLVATHERENDAWFTMESAPPDMWWYGPIPDPPEEARK